MKDIDFKDFKISDDILKALKKLGYDKPTEVQETTLPYTLENKDIIVKSQTGSGKTAAFAIPICEHATLEQREPQALILTPTRELAEQVKTEIASVGRLKKVRCTAIYGKQPMYLQINQLKQRVHAVVGTPGRTHEHIIRGNFNVDKIKYLIIDEADEMLNMGFIEQVVAIIDLLPTDRVTMLFSATMPEKIGEICNAYMKEPIKIEIESKIPTTKKIDQSRIEVSENEKFGLVNKLIYAEKPESAILFCNTRIKVSKLAKQMQRKGYHCEELHGGMEQDLRLETIKRFKRGKFHFLVATDVAARGIHVDDISLIVNFDVPNEKESYVHRIGRTGRAGSGGKAVTLFTSDETEEILEIEEYIGYKIKIEEAPDEKKVLKGKIEFEETIKSRPKPKKDTAIKLNRDITKIRINGGKNKKLRPVDIVGAISNIPNVDAEEIGIIDIQNTCTYVEVFGKSGEIVLRGLETTKIKGKIISFKKVRHRSL